MQLTKTFLVFSISLFPFFSSLSSAKAETSPATSIREETTMERRIYDGDLPSPSSDLTEDNGVPGADLCKTQSDEEQTSEDTENIKSNTQNNEKTEAKLGSQRIELHYVRDAVNITHMLSEIKNKLALNHLEIYHRNNVDNEIILYGPEKERECAYRIIAAIDLPRPGINMQMWGIQISTNKSKGREALNEVMPEVRDRINLTQQLVRDTFAVIQSFAIEQMNQGERDSSSNGIDPEFKKIVEDLGYDRLFDTTRPLSLLDIVIIANSFEDPKQFSKDLFKELMETMESDSRYTPYLEPYLEAMQAKQAERRLPRRPPFESFFRSRGLKPEYLCKDSAIQETKELPREKTESLDNLQKLESISECWEWSSVRSVDNSDTSLQIAQQNRRLIVEFGLQYGDFISNPDQFNPYELQHTSDALNGRLQDTTNAIQKDIEEFFMLPTLSMIQEIVSEKKSVEYAQLGRTTAATLSGIETKIGTSSVSAFDVTPPLKLSDLLTKASELQGQATNFIAPTGNVPGADTAKRFAVDKALPPLTVAALLAAFAEREAVFRELETGISLNFTPNVLRDLSSSELKINLTIADPVASPTEQQGVEPLSRIGKQTVNTTVYTQAIDFFALSTFSNQSTLNGGRGYVPIIGQVWRGIFSAIPVFGNLFSWQRPPQNVQHESLLLTNSFITPTSMGLALLNPMNGEAYEGKGFCDLQDDVEKYIKSLNNHAENSQKNQEIIFSPEDNNKVTKDWDDCVEAKKLQPEGKQNIAEDFCNCVEDRKLQHKDN